MRRFRKKDRRRRRRETPYRRPGAGPRCEFTIYIDRLYRNTLHPAAARHGHGARGSGPRGRSGLTRDGLAARVCAAHGAACTLSAVFRISCRCTYCARHDATASRLATPRATRPHERRGVHRRPRTAHDLTRTSDHCRLRVRPGDETRDNESPRSSTI